MADVTTLLASAIQKSNEVIDLVKGKFSEWDNRVNHKITWADNEVKKEIHNLESWKESALNIYDTIRPIDKVTIQPQGEDGDNAVFFMPEIADGHCYALIFQVNVSGDNDKIQYADVEIQYHNAGDNKYYHILNTTLDGRNWGDNYRDFNIVSVDRGFSYGQYHIKIINKSDKTIEIFAIGAKVSKTDVRPTK